MTVIYTASLNEVQFGTGTVISLRAEPDPDQFLDRLRSKGFDVLVFE